MDKLNSLLETLFSEEQIIQIVLSDKRKKSGPCKKVALRPILLRGALWYQAEYHQEKKVTHENMTGEEAAALCLRLAAEQFKQINIFSRQADYQILCAKPERPHIVRKAPSKTAGETAHNQQKQYIIPDGVPCDFLIRLGVMTKDGQVIPKWYNKFRQINRFLEIVSDALPALNTAKPLKIIDFGCGKAYLTFALYYYLHVQQGLSVSIVGLDLKEDVIDFCSRIARDLHYDDLHFLLGDIARYEDTASADMVVTLHACDTATDFALIKAVGWNAKVILSVPCCQHELFSQIENEINASILKQGILKERFSAILTDALRALKLEEHGYQVSMIEFTSLEHTAKNIMLRCVKLPAGGKTKTLAEKARAEYEQLTAFWHVTPTIGQMPDRQD